MWGVEESEAECCANNAQLALLSARTQCVRVSTTRGRCCCYYYSQVARPKQMPKPPMASSQAGTGAEARTADSCQTW